MYNVLYLPRCTDRFPGDVDRLKRVGIYFNIVLLHVLLSCIVYIIVIYISECTQSKVNTKNKINIQFLAVSRNINPKHPHRSAVPYVSAVNILEVTARPGVDYFLQRFYSAPMFTLPPHYPIFPCS